MYSGALSTEVKQRSEEIFRERLSSHYRLTDRLFAWLIGVQWLAGIVTALWISPRTWAGQFSSPHIHLWVAIFLGAVVHGFPAFLAIRHPGETLTRHVVAIGQMLGGGLLIHLAGGRVETHFQYFGALAFLSFYRDWRVLVSATVVSALDHFLRGIFWPQSIFGVVGPNWERALEHACWILYEDTFLVLAICQTLREMRGLADRQAELERVKATIELTVQERTGELGRAAQKELVLRREIHHRVKNNLQIITSLLYLQSSKVSDPHLLALLRDSQARIRSIALVHEMLYQREDLAQISFAAYVRQLAADLFVAYRVNPKDITLIINSGSMFLDLNTAVPCGIILAELLTNSLKYAFPDARHGVIEVEVHPVDSSGWAITVRDNGIGLPSKLNIQGALTMGINLVQDLTRQLGGTVEFRNCPIRSGTIVKLTLPVPSSHSP